ncbi:hypothetical protein H0H92_014006 [Tricholoma furcatifolium]|nr:hypothetical protein H0H92_014006 [Tricholoma furcatifolium]
MLIVSSDSHSQESRIAPVIARLATVLCDVNLYRRLVACQASDAQKLLDSFQLILDIPNLDPTSRKKLIVATQRLSTRSGLYPACYELRDVAHDSQHPIYGGGFADIYKGNFEGQEVCLKAIRLYQNLHIEHMLKQISKEAILWGQLSHPNVLESYGVFRYNQRICMVAPWMENGDVSTYLKHKPDTPRLPLALDVAEGLLYLHENGIIHGDLKGPNILIDNNGRAKLADFGISAVSDSNILAWTSQSPGGSKGGSARWQAPELCNLDNDEVVKNSPASDIYAWGCVAFELFTGEVPFFGITLDTTIVIRVKNGCRPTRPPPLSQPWRDWGLTEGIWELMEQSWKHSPTHRPSCAEVAERLRMMLSSDIQPILESGILTREAFRSRQRNVSLEIVTVEALDLMLHNAPDIDHDTEDDELNSLVAPPHEMKMESSNMSLAPFPSTSYHEDLPAAPSSMVQPSAVSMVPQLADISTVSKPMNSNSPGRRESSVLVTIAAVDSNDEPSLNICPPSPTLSTCSSLHSVPSVHFATSIDLRTSDPENGFNNISHSRRPSFASTSTIPDELPNFLSHNQSELSHSHDESITPTFISGDASKKGKQKAVSTAYKPLRHAIPKLLNLSRISSMAKQNVPQIAITNESTPNVNLSAYNTTFQSDLLSPSTHLPRSPTSTATAVDSGDEHSSSDICLPSPTLSTYSSVHSAPSVHFAPSTGLQANYPEKSFNNSSHSRRSSFASASTIPDEHNNFFLCHLKSELGHSHTESITPTFISDDVFKKGKQKAASIGLSDEVRTAHQPELAQDKDFNPRPFAYKPLQLAHLVTFPRSLDGMKHIGGTAALLRGLRTDAERGLTKEALVVNTGPMSFHLHEEREKKKAKAEKLGQKRRVFGWRIGAVEGVSQRNDGQEDDDTQEDDLEAKDEEYPRDLEPSEDVISVSVDERRRVYGANIIPSRPVRSLWYLMWLSLKDKVLVLLAVAAVIALALGLVQNFRMKRDPDDPPVDWVEGVAIIVAIVIVVSVGSLIDWKLEQQFKQLADKKGERKVKVIRDSVECVVDIKEVVVGDIVLLESGEVVPCDGVFISGDNVRCDEAGITGESNATLKMNYEECVSYLRRNGNIPVHADCYMISGSKVLEGMGRYVVIAVGTKACHGRIMTSVQSEPDTTPSMQANLNNLAEIIAKLGSFAGSILFTVLMIRFLVELGQGEPVRSANQKGLAFVNILIVSITLIFVAVPAGLPLAVTLALAFAIKRMIYDNLLVRVLGSCETIANASVVCTNKTGMLTQNAMAVVAGSIGVHAKFVRDLKDNSGRHDTDSKCGDVPPPGHDNADAKKDGVQPQRKNRAFSIDQARLNDVLSPALRDLFNEAIVVNSTALEDRDTETGKFVFVGSKTEIALLQFAKDLGWKGFRETHNGADVIQMIPFSSERKAMGVVVCLPNNAGFRFYLKGASEILFKKCNSYVAVHPPTSNNTNGWEDKDRIETKLIDTLEAENISRTIIFYANQTLRTIALCYRDFESWPPRGLQNDEEDSVDFADLAQDLTLIGIIGIEDPLRPGIKEAVEECANAGVSVRMCTGDNVLTARSIAVQCGIYTPGGVIMEGPKFRKLNKAERLEIVPRLQVLARSSPKDKEVLVSTLKSLGEIVGVTGGGPNDGPALKVANVGFSMGISGTEVAKEASDIVLMDGNFASIVKAIMWGRCVNDAVRKFLQFQISTNITAVVITFVSAVASNSQSSVLSAVQLLWINIIMDPFAALALATDPASESMLKRKPDRKSGLLTTNMYKQIFIQSIYQIAVILSFHFLGLQILGLHLTGNTLTDRNTNLIVQTVVFNMFVFAQIFNSINCRRIDRHLNIFENILRNKYFLAITFIEIGVQTLIVFVAGDAFQVTRIGAREWGISLALGFGSIPLGVVIRWLPDEPFERLFIKVGLLSRPEVLPTANSESETRNNTMNIVKENLHMFTNVRGGRLRSSSMALKGKLKRNNSKARPPMTTSTSMTRMPSILLGAVATTSQTGHLHPGSLSDPAASDPSKSSAALWDGMLQLHPDTPHDDPAYKLYGAGNQSNV